MPEQIKLSELEPGTLFKRGETYGFKSEYRNDKGICECYILGSGEMFWGGTGQPNNLKVEQIDFHSLIKQAEKIKELQYELLQANNQVHELDAFKNHAEFLLGERQYEYLEKETQMHLLREKADV
ncbi:hypothetical protein [Lysinibacillus parviboronicapiens]